LHLDGHDLRRCPIGDRKMLLRDVIGAAACERIVYVNHVLGRERELFETVHQIGPEASSRSSAAASITAARAWNG
jgi:ATP-dependent DNA ligase